MGVEAVFIATKAPYFLITLRQTVLNLLEIPSSRETVCRTNPLLSVTRFTGDENVCYYITIKEIHPFHVCKIYIQNTFVIGKR